MASPGGVRLGAAGMVLLLAPIGIPIEQPPLVELSAAAVATAPAERLDPPVAIEVTEPEPPTFASDCDEMSWYRQGAGLPARFDALGRRESRCTNTPISRTGCCVGFWQLHRVIWSDHRMRARLAACGATWANVRGDDAGSKRRQACAAKALYDVDGYSPWSTS